MKQSSIFQRQYFLLSLLATSLVLDLVSSTIDYLSFSINQFNIDNQEQYYNIFKCDYSQDDTQFYRSYLGHFSCLHQNNLSKDNPMFQINNLPPHYRSSVSFDLVYMQSLNSQQIIVNIDGDDKDSIVFDQTSVQEVNCRGGNRLLLNTTPHKIRQLQSAIDQNEDKKIRLYYSGQYQIDSNSNQMIIKFEEQCSQYSYLRLSSLDVSLNTCHPSCLQCSGPGEINCTKCSYQFISLGKCQCPIMNQLFDEGNCVDSCDQSQYKFQFYNQCILSKYCIQWDSNEGVCLKCEKMMPLLNGVCISECPTQFVKTNDLILPFCQFSQIGIQGEFLKQGMISNDFSILELERLGFTWSGFKFQNRQNGGVISMCKTFKLFGGFFLNLEQSQMQISISNTKYSKIKIFFKYVAIDIPDLSNDFIIANIDINNGKKSSQIQYLKSQDASSPNICGLSQIDKMGDFSFSFEADLSNPTIQIKITNLSPKSYFGIREFQVFGYNCETLYCVSCSTLGVCNKCKDGYYLSSDKKCLQCDSNCLTCQSSSTSCVSCPPNMKLIVGKNICQCYDTYYFDQHTNQCKRCSNYATCSKCSSDQPNICTQCLPNYYLLESTCLADCGLGYYKNTNNQTCVKCPPNCLKCLDSARCSECEANFLLQPNSQCSDSCPEETYYPDVSKKRCIKCKDPQCSSCLQGEDKCNKCNFPFNLQINICQSTCDSGFGPDVDRVCKKCSDLYLGCTKCNQGQCIECSSNQYFFPNVVNGSSPCVQTCPQNYYASASKVCNQCENQTCETCSSINPKNCTKCGNLLPLLQNGNCVSKCENQYYQQNSSSCQLCSNLFQGCSECTSTQCQSCLDKNKYLIVDQNQCIDICPDGYFGNDQFQCIKCSTVFSNCTKCTSQQCTKCQSDKYLSFITNECVDSCPLGTKEYSELGNQYCVQNCSLKNCIQCDSNQNCLKCDSKSTQPYLEQQKCVFTCSLGYTLGQPGSDSQFTCIKCSDRFSYCQSCDSQGCTQCQSSKPYYNPQIEKCVEQCPPGYYDSQKVCKKCLSDTCNTCDKSNSNNCLSCQESSQHPYLYTNKCVDICPSGYAPLQGVCQQCSKIYQDCSKCNSKGCTQCSNLDKYLHPESPLGCQQFCAQGYYLDNISITKECKKCLTNDDCILCSSTSPSLCKVCKLPNFNQVGNCVEKCDEGYLIDSRAYKCQDRCDKVYPGCLACNTIDLCTKCIDSNNYIQVDKSSCSASCPQGTAATTDVEGIKKCQQCSDENCNKCDPTNLNKCLECNSKTLLIQYTETSVKCVQTCPSTHYQEFNQKICSRCSKKYNLCEQCNTSGCLKCISDTAILQSDQQGCTYNCPFGQYTSQIQINGVNQLICKQCDNQECSTCDPKQPQNCLTCNNSLKFISKNKCVDICPQDEYIDEDTKTCLKTCNGEKIPNFQTRKCEICKQIIFKGVCVSDCPQGYFLNQNNSCIRCQDQFGESCTSCSQDGSKCTQCSQNTYLHSNNCVDKCPIGYIENKQNYECEKAIVKCEKGTYLDSKSQGCQQCSLNCAECQETSAQCIDCKDNYYLVQDTQECKQECPQNTYSQNKICISCSKNCVKCNNQDSCIQCLSTYYLYEGKCQENCQKPQIPIGQVCVDKCPDNYVHNQSKNLCIKCTDQCLKCDEEDGLRCTQCSKNTFLHLNNCIGQCPLGYVENKQNNECEKSISNCQKGTYFDQKSQRCQQCSLNCAECNESAIKCISCKDQFYLVNETQECKLECPQNTYKQNKECIRCPINCELCNSQDNCDQCQSNYYLYKGKCQESCQKPQIPFGHICIDKCPDNYAHKQSINQCIKCSDDCLECNEEAQCQKCKENLFIQKNQCVKQCDQGFFQLNQTCQQCSNNCINCQNSANNCIECPKNLILDPLLKKCQKCPEGTYFNKNECSKCPEDCLNCEKDSNNVLQCLEKCDISQGLFKVGQECKYCYGILGTKFSAKQLKCTELCGKGYLISPEVLKKYNIETQIECDDGNRLNKDGCSDSCQIEKGFQCKNLAEIQGMIKQSCFVASKQDGPIPKLNLIDILQIGNEQCVKCQILFDRNVKINDYLNWRVDLKNQIGESLQFSYDISPVYNETEKIQNHRFYLFIKTKQPFQNATLIVNFPKKESVEDENQFTLVEQRVNLNIHTTIDGKKEQFFEELNKQKKKQQNIISIVIGSILLSSTLLLIFVSKFYDFVAIFDTLQMINYLIYINMNLPNITYQTMRVFDFANFEVIPNQQQSLSKAPLQFQNENIDTFFFSNTIQIASIWGLAILLYGISKLVIKYVKITCLQIVFRPYEKKFKYFIIIGIGVLTFNDLLMASLLQLYESNFIGITLLGKIGSLIGLLLLMKLTIVISQSHHMTKNPSLNLQDTNSKIHQFLLQTMKPHKSGYNIIMILRKTVFIAALVYCTSPLQQCMIIHFIIGFEFTTLIQSQPFALKSDNTIQIICKGLLIASLSIITFIAYTDQIGSGIEESLKDILGIAISVIFFIIYLTLFLNIVLKAIQKFRKQAFKPHFSNKI